MKAIIIIFLALIFVSFKGHCSTTGNPQGGYISGAAIADQFNFVIERSSRWQQFRMVPEVWLEQLNRQTIDTIASYNSRLQALQNTINDKDSDIVALAQQLDATRRDYQLAVEARDSVSFLGLYMRKGFFVSVAIFLLVVMASFSAFLFVILQRTNLKTRETSQKIEEMTKTFEEYRQEARRKQEAMVIQHHKEIQRLRGNS